MVFSISFPNEGLTPLMQQFTVDRSMGISMVILLTKVEIQLFGYDK